MKHYTRSKASEEENEVKFLFLKNINYIIWKENKK